MPKPFDSHPATQNSGKSDWVLTESAWQKFLSWLDGGDNSEGNGYLEIHRRLVLYFDRKNCSFPDELADEVLNRVARRLEEEGSISIDAPAHYCYIVARFVFLESSRQKQNHPLKDDLLAAEVIDERMEMDKRSISLEKCMQGLDSEERNLILDYYRGQKRTKIENRKRLAAKRKLTMNALIIRVCRIRSKLEACVQKSLQSIK